MSLATIPGAVHWPPVTLPDPASDAPRRPFSPSPATTALLAVAVCAIIWGTTWYGITFQLGSVDPVASIVWRFGLAALVLFAIRLVGRRPLGLTRAQHLAAMGQGVCAFSISYACVYVAEARVASAVVAVIFAALALFNLVLFRLAANQRAGRALWAGAALGALGVAVLSGGELARAEMDDQALIGVGLSFLAVMASAGGNYFAWRGERAGSDLVPQTAWAMAWGTIFLAAFGLMTGVRFTIEPTAGYLLSLLYLSLFGSVAAFLTYFWLARRRGYGVASYISALTPPIAMLVSVLFEGARFGWAAFIGLAIVLAGQALIIRAPKT